MPAAHDYAERLRARLPRRLQEVREAAGMSRSALEKKCIASREMIGCIGSGVSIPTLHRGAWLEHGMGSDSKWGQCSPGQGPETSQPRASDAGA